MALLKIIAVAIALFIAYLWSGGVWNYHPSDKMQRVHKITGEVNVLEFDPKHRVYFWRNAMEHVPMTEKELEKEWIEQNPAALAN